MSLSKLRKIHIIIIGSVLCVIAVVAMFFLLVKPKNEAFAAAKARYDTAIVLGTPEQENRAISERNAAILDVGLKQREMQVEMAKRMPDLSFANRELGMLQLWREQLGTLKPLLEGFAKDRNVNSVSASFSIPPPPLNPNDPVFDQDVLIFPLGNVQVTGSNFMSVMNNIRRWNNCRRLVMVGPPALVGNSPNLTAVYSLTCYVFPVAKGGPTVQMAGAANGQQVGP